MLATGQPEAEVPVSEDSHLEFLNDISSTSLSGILNTLSDSNFKRAVDTGDLFEHIDFEDMFTQLKSTGSPKKMRSDWFQETDQNVGEYTVKL